MPSPGTDINSERNARGYVLQEISRDYHTIPLATLSQIIKTQHLIEICKSTSSTTAFALRSKVRQALLCIPHISVNFISTGTKDTYAFGKINENATDFFEAIHCYYERNTPVNYSAIKTSGEGEVAIRKMLENCLFRGSDTVHRELLVKVSNDLYYTLIPITVRSGNTGSWSDELQIFFNRSGIITDIAYYRKITLGKTVPVNIRIFLNKLITNFFINRQSILDSLKTIAFSSGQNDYLNNLRQTLHANSFIRFSFEQIEICPIASNPSIYGVSIHHGWQIPGSNKVEGYLTLFLEAGKQVTLNNFKWTHDKYEPWGQ